MKPDVATLTRSSFVSVLRATDQAIVLSEAKLVRYPFFRRKTYGFSNLLRPDETPIQSVPIRRLALSTNNGIDIE